MKVALAQINTTVADFDGTVRKVSDYVKRAKSARASLIAFPELTTTGYPPRDLVEVPSFVEKNIKALEEIALLAKGIDLVVGFVDRNPKTGGSVSLPGKYVPHFKPGKELRERVNDSMNKDAG